ncbi:MAG: uncharacterized membrane protein YjgN (DUF898 family) [Maribacter sp.]|jgi:uncharacterized membrane protein YjgN (DUF898 family)
MQRKKEILNVFFKTGMVQILPAILSILMIIGIVIIVYLLAFNNAFQPRSWSSRGSFTPSNKDILKFSIAISICLFFLSGLISFIASSFHFIRAKQTNDYERLTKGMKYLNWGWLVLCLFVVIIFSIFLFN